MTQQDLDRMTTRIESINNIVIRIDESLKSFPYYQKTILENRDEIMHIKQKCANIQEHKIKVNRNLVFTELIIGGILILVSYYLGKGGFL